MADGFAWRKFESVRLSLNIPSSSCHMANWQLLDIQKVGTCPASKHQTESLWGRRSQVALAVRIVLHRRAMSFSSAVSARKRSVVFHTASLAHDTP